MTIALKRKLNNYYDSPNKERLDIALESSDDIIGVLTAHLNDDSLDDDIYYLTHVFALYVVATCLYSMVQFECISRYAESDNERNTISVRIADEIERASSMYSKISDRLYQKTSNRFTKIVTRLHEPWINWFTWPKWRTSYYVYE